MEERFLMNFPYIVIGLILLIIVWLYLDFTWAEKSIWPFSEDGKHPSFMETLILFPHGKELFADYFHELKMARHHIHILFYIVKDDQFSQEFFTILKTKAKEGVEVRLLVDRVGSIR